MTSIIVITPNAPVCFQTPQGGGGRWRSHALRGKCGSRDQLGGRPLGQGGGGGEGRFNDERGGRER